MLGDSLISVIIPVFNRPELVSRAINSVLSQNDANYELIVVDDGSSLDMGNIEQLLAIAGEHYYRIPHSGVSKARNFGVSHAKGNWLAFLDSDDSWLPDKLSKQRSFSKQYPEFRLFHCEEKWYRNGQFVNPGKRHQKANCDAFYRSLELCCISPSAVLIERRLFQQSGGFDTRLKVCEDYDLWLRLLAKEPIGLLSQSLVEKFGGHSDQLSRSVAAIDRFRVYAMVKLLLEQELTLQQEIATWKEIALKSNVIANGAKKRSSELTSKLFTEIYHLALRVLPQDRVPVQIRSELKNYFPALLAEISNESELNTLCYE